MFFEGSEKKVEVVVSELAPSLRSLGKNYWSNIVSQANAEILSTVSNEQCDAYLLSESSLFVWDHHFVMLTCGTTTLVNAVLSFLESYESDQLLSLIFQRKNEYLSHLQKSSFSEDIDKLQQNLSGKAYQLGNLDTHHNYVYHLDKPYVATPDDYTYELLMYHIHGDAAQYLRSEHQSAATIRELLELDKLLPGFEINDFVFAPFGYSMNAIKGHQYATIHITPQEESSYVSFETNLDLSTPNSNVIERLTSILQPNSFDIISFNGIPNIQSSSHTLMNHVSEPLTCGYTMRFYEFMRSEPKIGRAVSIL
ncbi:adenosylmethionine decarboxylase [Marinomonas mediterranea]|uniref:adenosylmethionine decarboxylase n=1 Tax=Marinomonas mediterranea TaxID=119864 RepID=UPI00234B5929|nr:adenosylmethionine decarboxylase [Marinomonas mediterranea]WCN15441.1 adenosylmethionine decarboxylase [Marinomonas mediterranea]